MSESWQGGPNGPAAALPRPRSFVVQLAADAAPSEGAIRGRAVHITSGEAAPFESMAELVGFLACSIARAERDATCSFASADAPAESTSREEPT